MDVVTELREPVQARAEMNAEEFGAGAPAQSASEGQEEDDEFQTIPSARRSVKSTSCLDMCSTGRGVGTVQRREV